MFRLFIQSEHVLLNINVFICFLNELRQSVARMASGTLFERREAAIFCKEYTIGNGLVGLPFFRH